MDAKELKKWEDGGLFEGLEEGLGNPNNASWNIHDIRRNAIKYFADTPYAVDKMVTIRDGAMLRFDVKLHTQTLLIFRGQSRIELGCRSVPSTVEVKGKITVGPVEDNLARFYEVYKVQQIYPEPKSPLDSIPSGFVLKEKKVAVTASDLLKVEEMIAEKMGKEGQNKLISGKRVFVDLPSGLVRNEIIPRVIKTLRDKGYQAEMVNKSKYDTKATRLAIWI